MEDCHSAVNPLQTITRLNQNLGYTSTICEHQLKSPITANDGS